MKIEITKVNNRVSDFFAAPLSVEGEAELQNLQLVDQLLELMKQQGVSRVELARRMGIQPSRVTAMLSGTGNFTTQTMVRAARALDAKYHHCVERASKSVRWQAWDSREVHPDFLRTQAVPRKAQEVTFHISDHAHEDSSAAA